MKEENRETVVGEYVCYCNKVTEQDIIEAIKNGAKTIEEVIEVTGAMKNSNCKVNIQKDHVVTVILYMYTKNIGRNCDKNTHISLIWVFF